MAGNKTLFDSEMLAGDNAAFDERWDQAIDHYMKAVREFPTSTLACNSLGLALFNAGRLEDALKVYTQSQKLDPEDPLPAEKMADVYERQGRLNDAAKQYVTVAEIYLAQHDLEKAIGNWERATRITPGMVRIHQKLALAYERTGQRGEAVNEYLKLAYNFQNTGNSKIAEQALERALRLDSKDSRVLNAFTAVRNNQQISADLMESHKTAAKAQTDEDIFGFDLTVADADERGPIGEALEYALETLAHEVFNAGTMDMSAVNAIQGIEMHRAGIHEEAIGAYQRAEAAGMKTPPLLLNLGYLLYQNKKYGEAITFLQRVKGQTTLSAGAAHALSLSYLGMEKWLEAAKSMINALRLIDLSLAVNEDETRDLNNFYVRVLNLVEHSDPQTLRNFCESMSKMLIGADWKRRVAQTRNRLSDMIAEDANTALETIAKGEHVIDAMAKVDQYEKQRMYHLALDEAHHIIQQAPDYLAAHLRVAQLSMALSQVDAAITKYNLIARTYLLRGDQGKAAEILNEVIQIAPADLNLRSNLIELLEQQERWDDVMHQYLELGNVHRELADATNARLTYDLALKIARQKNIAADKVAEVYYAQGELDMDRLDWRGALRNFQKVLETLPADLRTRRQVVDIYYRLNDPIKALEELDKLLQVYARQKRGDLILQVLEDQVINNPHEMGLRARLGAVYQQMNKPEKAIEQYDELTKLQLAAHMNEDAAKTLKKILSLNPPNSAAYQQKLQSLSH